MMNSEKKDTPDRREDRSAIFRVKVWDLPTRCFHWAIVVLVIVSFATGTIGGTAMKYHEKSGVAILVLLLFRLVWGFTGGRESRFAAFVRGPKIVVGYASALLKRESHRHLGHNPLGGWSVLLLLISLLVQAATGLFANDDILTEGPLFGLVSKAASDSLTGIHLLNKNIIAVLVGVHVAAILFYLIYKRDNLIVPMFSGEKKWHQEEISSTGKTWLAAIIAAVAALAVYQTLY